jgi:hypothetical protein
VPFAGEANRWSVTRCSFLVTRITIVACQITSPLDEFALCDVRQANREMALFAAKDEDRKREGEKILCAEVRSLKTKQSNVRLDVTS